MTDKIILQSKHMQKVDDSGKWIHPAWKKRLNHLMPVMNDYSISEQKIELETKLGHRMWLDFKEVFGIVICEAKNILIEYEDPTLFEMENLKIDSILQYKIRRTNYVALVFAVDPQLPF